MPPKSLTKDDILRFAAAAGFVVDEQAKEHQPNCIYHTSYMIDEQLELFAGLVMQHERKICITECEKLEDEFSRLEDIYDTENDAFYRGKSWGAADCADAIKNLNNNQRNNKD